MPSATEDAVSRRRKLAERDLLAGKPEVALQHLAALGDHDDEASFLRARADAALGRHGQARDRLLALRARLAAPSATLLVHLATAQWKLGEVDAAIGALREALQIAPAFAAAHRNLATLLGAARPEALGAALRAAVAAVPADADLWVRLAQAEAAAGDGAAALAALARARALEPDPGMLRRIGYLYAEYWRYPDALAALDRASALDPGDPQTETVRSALASELGDEEGAQRALALAARRDPHDLHVALAERLRLPQAYDSTADLERWRDRFSAGLASLEAEAPRWHASAGQVFDMNRTHFLLAYQGEDDRELQRRHAAFIAGLAGRAVPRWREPRRATYDGGRRLRVAFVGDVFRECTAGRYFERWIGGLDARRFERVVYHTAPIVDALGARVAAACDRFEVFRGGTRALAERLEAEAHDTIVYPEVGMAPAMQVLSVLRLAPLQVAGWGHPVTTGSDAIDLYLTPGAMEPADGDAHYVEVLARLPGLGVDYPMPAAPPPMTRAAAGLAEGRRLYLCAQSLFKVHPDMDQVVADVLERDPEAVVAFFQSPARRVTEQVGARLQRALAARGIVPRGQLKFLGRVTPERFRSVVALSDVVLDTVRFSGGNTSLDAFAAGTPVVTHEGRFMRGRQTAAMLRAMGLSELVAARPEDCARIAVAVASDRARNAELRRTIAGARAALFGQAGSAAALADALEKAAAHQ